MMSLHKLTAGSGYDYLTRQVAAQDSTAKGHTSLADYYEQKGESPGRWLGSGLVGIEGLEPQYQLIVDREGTLDTLEVRVEVSDRIFTASGSVKVLQNIERRITKDIKDYLGISAKVKLVDPRSLQRSEGKTSRVIDKRQI